MLLRTLLRIIINDIFVNNAVVRLLVRIVKICYDFIKKTHKKLKLKKSLPIKNVDTKRNVFFLSITGDKVDYA